MLGKVHFQPWVGSHYDSNSQEPRLLVVGESRFCDDYTDRNIIQDRVNGNRHPTFTNFVQAATGLRHWESGYDEPGFWNRVIFYNYNTTVFPGGARELLPWEERMNSQNSQSLREVLQKWKPTHAVVWGFSNWNSLVIEGEEWSEERTIPGTAEPYCTTSGFTTLFARTKHPSAGFENARWTLMLETFLAMRVPVDTGLGPPPRLARQPLPWLLHSDRPRMSSSSLPPGMPR